MSKRESLPVLSPESTAGEPGPCGDALPGHPAGDRFGRDRSALRKPDFLKRPVGKGAAVAGVKHLLRSGGLVTVCEEARCPNLGECFERRTATFMILGKDCTRACGFCAVGTARPKAPEPDEPLRVAAAAASLGLSHVVVTSVNRDDLPDGGSGHFAAVMGALRDALPDATLEVLTPDFCGDLDAVRRVADAPIDVYNHNIETVPRLYDRVRPKARYARSLEVLETVAREYPTRVVKSGLMVGLGETRAEVLELMADLKAHGVQIVTIGQYLRPSLVQVPVAEYLTEEAYAGFRAHGRALGFEHVFAGPFVRSSYHAAEALLEARRGATP
ncbi:lipoyl synthase [Myxococcota bacterium]|nr:lipoyl synthase [Myxococcota bacterium]